MRCLVFVVVQPHKQTSPARGAKRLNNPSASACGSVLEGGHARVSYIRAREGPEGRTRNFVFVSYSCSAWERANWKTLENVLGNSNRKHSLNPSYLKFINRKP